MPFPSANVTIKQMVARTAVIAALSYLLLQRQVGGESLWDHTMVGGVGALGSIVSEGYVEGMSMMA